MELIKLLQIKGISEATQEDIILNFLECIDEESALAIVEEYEQAEMSLTESIINEVSLGYALKKSLGGAVQRFKDIRKKQANVSTDRPIGLAGIRKQEAQKQDVVKSQERFKQAKDTAKDIVNRMLNTRYTRDNKVAKAPEVKATQTAEPTKTQTAEPTKTQTAEPAKTQTAKTQTVKPAKIQAVKPAKTQAVKTTKVAKAPEVKAETTQVAKPAKAPEVKTTQIAKPAKAPEVKTTQIAKPAKTQTAKPAKTQAAKTQTAKATKVTKAPEVKAKTVEAGNANAEAPKVKATKPAKAPKVKAEATETGNTKVAEVVKKAITKAKEEPKQEQSKTEAKKEEKQPVAVGAKEPTLSSSDREKLQKQLERLSNLPYSDKVAAKMSEIEKRLS